MGVCSSLIVILQILSMIKRKTALCIGICFLLHGIANSQANNKQSKNIYTPVRISFVPGLSTQGKNDIYTTSNFSLNILGGITGSVQGVELGSLFNINKGNMQGVQHAGWFNITGGFVNGVQMAG